MKLYSMRCAIDACPFQDIHTEDTITINGIPSWLCTSHYQAVWQVIRPGARVVSQPPN